MTKCSVGSITFSITLAMLTIPLAADAQQPAKVYRIGYLGDSSPSAATHLVQAFRLGLREFGYVEGRNITI
jgi:hypothetical protein